MTIMQRWMNCCRAPEAERSVEKMWWSPVHHAIKRALILLRRKSPLIHRYSRNTNSPLWP